MIKLATDKIWDAIVIGAGPAGAFAAYLLAKECLSVLLVDKCKFPRSKVCGCCINMHAAKILNENSLGHVLAENRAISLEQLNLFDGNTRAKIALPGGYSLSRSQFDNSIVQEATKYGVTFLSETAAHVLDSSQSERLVRLKSASHEARHEETEAAAKVVLVADGLSGRSLERHGEFENVVTPQARFGCGTIVASAPDFYEPGHIYMACSPGGYVGLVKLEDNRVDIAAALDKDFARTQAGVAGAAAAILHSCNLPLPIDIVSAPWTGTEPLTRKRRNIAAERLFVIGDACGYAEPFTGEGIAWALKSAAGVQPFALAGVAAWNDKLVDDWQLEHRKLIASRQFRSGAIAQVLRIGVIRQMAMPMISAFPELANSIARLIAA